MIVAESAKTGFSDVTSNYTHSVIYNFLRDNPYGMSLLYVCLQGT